MPSTVRCAALLAVPAVCGLVAPPTRPSRTRLHSTVTQDLGTTTAPLLDDAATARAVAAMREDARTKPLSDDELTWFARDRRGDAREAVEKVVQYLRWRKDRGGLGADRDALMRRAAPEARRRVGYLAREKDALNRPTVVVVARRHDAMRRDLKASQALCVAVLEDAIAEAVKEGGEQVLALVDLRQVGPQNVDVPFLLWLIMTLRSYFPKRLGQVALVDPPPVLFEAVRLQRPTRPFPDCERRVASTAYELRETRLSVRHRRDA
uniref:CRAL-TRIO domain-containing protein n=1 Tax=Pelagomonas calceolata TaxID=35677 RepID=A0A7S4E2H0_9STRA|mmetsp:Transcript_25433/g.77400  ORF Transcript_25433/g.77400 Transcript_25433/m.77400 type:complete len:265 (-) Transcript_25433:146-940(-)